MQTIVSSWQEYRLWQILLAALVQLSSLASTFADENWRNELVPPSITWSPVAAEERASVLQLLCNHTKGNYEKIQTWDATFDVVLRQLLTEDYVAKTYDRVPPDSGQSAMTEVHESTIRVVIDMKSGDVFRDVKARTLSRFMQASGKRVEIPKTGMVNQRSIVTSDSYIHFSPGHVWSISELPEHPQAKRKPAAFRDPKEDAKSSDHSQLLDPRAFFGWSRDNVFWGAFSKFAEVLKSNRSDEYKRQVDNAITVEKATRSDGTWYRVRTKMGTDAAGATSIWSSKVGYYPVSCVLALDAAGEEPLLKLSWQWKAVNGIFVPFRFYEASYTGANRTLSYEREVSTENCVLNRPLASGQFDYAALGLANGDLVVDRIERIAYVVRNGDIVKLAAFGEPYTPANGTGSLRWWLLAVNVVVLVVSLIWLVRKRLRAGSPPTTRPA